MREARAAGLFQGDSRLSLIKPGGLLGDARAVATFQANLFSYGAYRRCK